MYTEKQPNMIAKNLFKKFLFAVFTLFSSFISAQEANTFKANTIICKEVTSKYFNAYFKLDFDAMKPLMHDSISFEDPTAKLVFGGKKVEGKSNVYENFKKGYASIIEMNQETIRTIFSSNTGIFEINLNWKMKNGPDKIITINMPLIVVLTVENGKVISHVDYGDYNYFIEQYYRQIKQDD